jgi:hypothetical protein
MIAISVDQPPLIWPWRRHHEVLLGQIVHSLASDQLCLRKKLIVHPPIASELVEYI